MTSTAALQKTEGESKGTHFPFKTRTRTLTKVSCPFPPSWLNVEVVTVVVLVALLVVVS